MSSKIRSALLSLILLLTLFPPAVQARDIHVGQSVDLSGPLGYLGRDYVAGAKVYFDHVNSKGGVNGRKIVHLVQDNGGSADKSSRISQEFIQQHKVDALFGYFGEGSLENLGRMDAFRQSGIPLVAPLTGLRPGNGAARIYYIRPEYSVEARKLVAFFARKGVRRFAVVYAQDDYGRAVLQAVEAELKRDGLSMEGGYAVSTSGDGLDKAIDGCREKKPQATILALQTLPAAQFVKAYRKHDQGGFLMGLSLINNETLFEFAGKDANGVMLSEVVPHPNDALMPISAEHQRIMKIYRDEPPSHLTLEGFIAAKYLVQAMKKAGKGFTPGQLADALDAGSEIDLGGFFLAYSSGNKRGSSLVDINVISKNGRLLN